VTVSIKQVNVASLSGVSVWAVGSPEKGTRK